MEKITYPTGLWSIRDGHKLTWGKDGREKSTGFGEKDTITAVAPGYHPMIRKAGKNPDDFVSAGMEIIAKTLVPEIEACIAFARSQSDQKRAKEKSELDSSIASGEAFRTVEIAAQYGAELTWARRFREEEKPEYAEWFRDLGMVGFSASKGIKVEESAVRRVIGERRADGQFCGCENQTWTITAEEWDRIIAISAGVEAEKAASRKRFAEEEEADIQRKIETGYCFSCESWCHGDCGHYSKDPDVKFRHDLKEMEREANYGINDNA